MCNIIWRPSKYKDGIGRFKYGRKQDTYIHALLAETKQVSVMIKMVITMIRIDYLIHI